MNGMGTQGSWKRAVRWAVRWLLCLALVLPAVRHVAAQEPHEAAAPAAREQASREQTSGEQTSPSAEVSEKNEQEKDENYEYRHSAAVEGLAKVFNLSPEVAATAFTVFNFAVLAVVVGVFLVKTLPNTFRQRSQTIQKELIGARTATEEAKARLSSVEARLGKLDAEIAAMKQQAEADSARDELRMKASVEDEKQKVVAAAEAEVMAASAMARRELQRYAAELAIEQAARSLVVTAETDRLLVESFAHKLGPNGGHH